MRALMQLMRFVAHILSLFRQSQHLGLVYRVYAVFDDERLIFEGTSLGDISYPSGSLFHAVNISLRLDG